MSLTISEAAERSLSACGGDAAEFFIAADFPAFNGHFPGKPLLPGVAQVELCLAAAARLHGRPLRLRHLARAKFSRPVLPDTKLIVKVAADGERHTFTVSDATGAPVSRIQLTVEPA